MVSGLKEKFPKISSSLHFVGYEQSDEWEILEDEIYNEDTPKDMVFPHPLGSDECSSALGCPWRGPAM